MTRGLSVSHVSWVMSFKEYIYLFLSQQLSESTTAAQLDVLLSKILNFENPDALYVIINFIMENFTNNFYAL